MTDTKSIRYQHDNDGSIFLVEDNLSHRVMNGHTFVGTSACTVVHELNNAITNGRNNGGTSAYRTDGCHIYFRYHPRRAERVVPVYELNPQQTDALAFELHQAGQIGAYS